MYPREFGSTEHSEDNGEWKSLLRSYRGELSCSASVRESAVAVPSMEKESGQRF